MVDPSQYIKEGLSIVDKLVAEGNFQAALQSCQELSKVNPYDRRIQKKLKKIEEQIIHSNQIKVDRDIDATMHLWKEKKYEELLHIYNRLMQYAPHYKRLRGLIEKAQSELLKTQTQAQQEFERKAFAAIESLINEKKWADAIQACNEFLHLLPLHKTVQAYLGKAKEGLIEQKLEENEYVMHTADFEKAVEFYKSLLAIDPNNRRVQKLILNAEGHWAEQKLLAERIHLNESMNRMKDLFRHTEYEKVMQACEEILRLDPKNFTAKLFREKAKSAITREIDQAVVKKLFEVWDALAPEYKKNPEGFTRV